MDVGAFVQENRRWLIGVAIGGLVYLIGSVVIGSIYDPQPARARMLTLARSAGNAQLYGRDARQAASDEADQLAAAQQRLRTEIAFQPAAKYQPQGRDVAEYLFQVGRELKQRVLDQAAEREVQLGDKDLTWDVPTGVDEIRDVLLGLDVVETACQRLFAAHDAVRQKDPAAMGLRAVQMKLESRRGQRAPLRSLRPGEVDLRDLIEQQTVSFTFQSDVPTWIAFLEACRQDGRTLALGSWTVQGPARAGEPCTVKGTLSGLSFKESK